MLGGRDGARPAVRRRGLHRPLVLTLVVIAAIAVFTFVALLIIGLAAESGPGHRASSGPSPAAGPVEQLSKLMAPVGQHCVTYQPVFGEAANINCDHLALAHTFVIAYQYKTVTGYLDGVRDLNVTTGFGQNRAAADRCPPPPGRSSSYLSWRSSEFPAASGQQLECLLSGPSSNPTLVWTMPGERTVWTAQGLKDEGVTLPRLYRWWQQVYHPTTGS